MKKVDKNKGKILYSFDFAVNRYINRKGKITKESIYLDALEHKDYYPNFDKIRDEFVNAKAKLYSNSHVKRYLDLERRIQFLINDDINELKESISNKFTKNKTFF